MSCYDSRSADPGSYRDRRWDSGFGHKREYESSCAVFLLSQMAASQAFIAASRLLNLRIPAFQSLLHRHPSVALSVQPTATTPNQSLNLFHPQNDSPDNSSTVSFRASNLPLNFPLPLGFRGMQIEAAGKASTPKDDDYDLEDPDEDSDAFDVEDDDVDIENFSGLDFDSPGSDEE